MNIAEIEMRLSDLVKEPFDRSGFVFKFIEIFNPPPATLTKLRKAESKPDNELLWSRKLPYRVGTKRCSGLGLLLLLEVIFSNYLHFSS